MVLGSGLFVPVFVVIVFGNGVIMCRNDEMDVRTVECFVKFRKSLVENGGRVWENW